MRGNGDKKRRALEALEAGPIDTAALAMRAGMTVRQASSALQWLRACGIAQKVGQVGRNRPGMWALVGAVHRKVFDGAQTIT